MKKQMYSGVTWLYLLNFCILQLLWMRVVRTCQIDDAGERTGTIGFTLVFGFVPLTGWLTRYIQILGKGERSFVLWTSPGLKRWRARWRANAKKAQGANPS